MDYRKENNTIYLRIDKDEELMETITSVCKKEKITGGSFHGIGACNKVELSTWIIEKNDFIFHTKEGMLEMISIMGNISLDSTRAPILHAHATFSYLNQDAHIATIAGHVKTAHISYTGEIIIQTTDSPINRKFDHNAGIEVWDF